MTFDLWWLLAIPAIFAAGWGAARFDARQVQGEQRNLPRAYFKGLNFLLNEQPDQAIDAFIEVARLDPETIDLHFALGRLFRRRGETERAIRVHQNLVNRPDLPVADRDRAMFELGQDFLKAGLLDRAESALQMSQQGAYAQAARRTLLEIYEIEKDWRKAIDAATALHREGATDLSREIAQFHCELAHEALRRKDMISAQEAIDTALAANPANVRALMLRGEVAQTGGELDAAIVTWRAIENLAPQYVPLIAPGLVAALDAAGQSESALDWLQKQMSRHPSELLDLTYRQVFERRGAEAALFWVRGVLRSAPSLAALAKLFDVQAVLADETSKPDLLAMRDLIMQRTRNLSRYTCGHCGFRARLFYWQCPGCNHWETYAPRRAEVLGTPGPSM